ncbi:MFS transporter [Alkalihalobacillus alcalophilus ATCC 27647 = CGMCC 1.3604]|uniref:MFS transporter n=3 Tax=Alkalihalobacillus alcalophilus ATCC 27647 = CGMCC 1.3604 TaxID=1218173 RepID=A0A4S4K2R3_ALKAL|nr:MFS transporter [Alkalihalobacillus alcalophilus]MED1560828.1 MFS transporter [Alkalihalobacillus alcalophilus]THG91217.1 MFS transporter [Alkalihalobacillus alcalophilus ATCC 27647 = CGMCC 1.3604]
MSIAQNNSPNLRLIMLVVMVFVAGFVQGMLLPLLAIVLEQAGYSSAMNGMNAVALYIGVLLASPFIEHPVRKYGYKPVISIGLIVIIATLLLFPLWQSFWFWFVLRLIIGVADNMVHFSTQVWITSTSSKAVRGRNIAIYGLAFSAGFAGGPLMTNLLAIDERLPFVIAALFCAIIWLILLKIRNEWPDNTVETIQQSGTLGRYWLVIKYGWFAFLPPLAFGFMEATIHGSYPIYALLIGIDVEWLSIILPAFVIGGVITQIPLGILSDRVGRKKVLLILAILGAGIFLTLPQYEEHIPLLIIAFLVSGGLLGSFYSLGLMYLADLLPKQLLPTGNVLIAISFSIGSMLGPLIGGVLIDWIGEGSLYYAIGCLLLIIISAGVIFRPTFHQEEA